MKKEAEGEWTPAACIVDATLRKDRAEMLWFWEHENPMVQALMDDEEGKYQVAECTLCGLTWVDGFWFDMLVHAENYHPELIAEAREAGTFESDSRKHRDPFG